MIHVQGQTLTILGFLERWPAFSTASWADFFWKAIQIIHLRARQSVACPQCLRLTLLVRLFAAPPAHALA